MRIDLRFVGNLNSHTNVTAQGLVTELGHKLAFRVPHHPVDEAIEHISNETKCALRIRLRKIHSDEDCVKVLTNAIQKIPDSSPFFNHVGFAHN